MDKNGPIIVGVDGSTASFDAVRWATRAAELRGAPLTLVSVYQITDVYTTFAAMPPQLGSPLRLEVNKSLEAASAIAKAAAKDADSLSIVTEAIVGAAIPTLVERSASARMIVVGTRGNGEYFAELLGSVSAAVSERAECPVAIISGIPQTGEREGPVVLGVDGSSASSRAVGVAFEEASLRGSELVAVHTWAHDAELWKNHSESDKEALASAQNAAASVVLTESLAGWQEQYPDVHVNRVVEHGGAVSKIRELSTSARTVVVGSRGRGGFSGLLLGSTSRSLSHLLECPLIIARGPKNE
ncbi:MULTISPECIES: universal stress protein [unclassified Rhodococcus (in: high G+C Gram-positive bacteria)]|uniref:universal stress protein n=1 Tax=unclassified Rhodococcus (in: high G+C Gram-positive bacteria) TaxID=192944 RepID=UPI0022AE8D2B|nr:universal stress protein [Rhodococcus sp. H36-A4]MCZ4077255.1 universal stress protein [Rhodococcus sp. H36-A4]